MRLLQTTGKLQTDGTAGASQTYNFASSLTAGSVVVLSGVQWNVSTAKITAVTASGTSGTNDVRKTDSGGGANSNNAETWSVSNIAGGSTALVLTAASGSYISMSAEEWRGFYYGTIADRTGTAGDTTSAAPTVTASATPVYDYELVYASFVDYLGGVTWTSSTPPSGATETFEEPNSAAHEAGSAAYKLINNGTSGAPTMAFGVLNGGTPTSINWDAALATYRVYYPGHNMAVDLFGVSNTSITTGAFDTNASPGAILVFEGRGALSDFSTQVTNDNKGNGTYTALAAAKAYTNWSSSGTQVLYKLNPAGGAGHTVTATKPTNTDELTVLAVEVPPGYSTIQDWKWNEDLTHGTNTSLSVTTTGPAWLYCFTSGDDVNGWANPNPPINDGWYKLEHTSSVTSFHVQCAAYAKFVSAAGTYNCVQTPDIGQGSQMWILALQASSGGAGGGLRPACLL